jgi:hypothetical protein
LIPRNNFSKLDFGFPQMPLWNMFLGLRYLVSLWNFSFQYRLVLALYNFP